MPTSSIVPCHLARMVAAASSGRKQKSGVKIVGSPLKTSSRQQKGLANAKMHGSTKGALSQRELEAEILKLCAKGRDKLDKQMAPDVKIVPVKPGSACCEDFPMAWRRREGGKRTERGTAEWYVPKGADPKKRMLFFHGGSYTVWAPKDAPYRSLCSRLAAVCRLCVLSVDYRMAPEHLFPAAFEDSAAALCWIAGHGPDSAMEPSPATDIFVCGDSAGGGLALAVCMAPPRSVRPMLRGAVGLSPWIDMTASTPSYETRQWDPERGFGDAVNAGTDRKGGQGEAEVYLGRGGVKLHGKDWRVSPFFALASKLRNMPPVLLHVGDYELILDESVLLHQKMVKGRQAIRTPLFVSTLGCGIASMSTLKGADSGRHSLSPSEPFKTSASG